MLTFEKQVPDNPTYYYRSTGVTETELNRDVGEAWVEILKRIRENREDGSWNRLLFECWCFDGFVLAYPHRREPALSEIKKTLESNDFTCWTMKNADVDHLLKFDIFFR